jgi:hypothetical protein
LRYLFASTLVIGGIGSQSIKVPDSSCELVALFSLEE